MHVRGLATDRRVFVIVRQNTSAQPTPGVKFIKSAEIGLASDFDGREAVPACPIFD